MERRFSIDRICNTLERWLGVEIAPSVYAFNAARIILPWLLPLTSLELRYCHMYKRISGGVIFLLCAGFLISFLVWQPMLPETTFNELKIISRLSATDLFIIFAGIRLMDLPDRYFYECKELCKNRTHSKLQSTKQKTL